MTQSASPSGQGAGGDAPATVLVVADSTFARLDAVTMCRENGYHVVEATTQADALRQYIAVHPQAVLLDGSTMREHGLPVIGRLVAIDSAARIVLLAAHATQNMIWDAVRAGARDVVIKPYDAARLARALGTLVAPPTERQHVRVPVNLKASVGFASTPGAYHVGVIENLSVSGARCHLAAPLPGGGPAVDTVAQVKFVLPDGQGLLLAVARVVRVIAPDMVALAFVSISPAHTTRVDAYCRRILATMPAVAAGSPDARTA